MTVLPASTCCWYFRPTKRSFSFLLNFLRQGQQHWSQKLSASRQLLTVCVSHSADFSVKFVSQSLIAPHTATNLRIYPPNNPLLTAHSSRDKHSTSKLMVSHVRAETTHTRKAHTATQSISPRQESKAQTQ